VQQASRGRTSPSATIIASRLASIPTVLVTRAGGGAGRPFLAGAGSFWKLGTLATMWCFTRSDARRSFVIALSLNQPLNHHQHGNRMWGCCQILIRVSINFRQPPPRKCSLRPHRRDRLKMKLDLTKSQRSSVTEFDQRGYGYGYDKTANESWREQNQKGNQRIPSFHTS
jgi:hypothetical protein